MNSTNRALNRGLVFVIGLLLLVAGGGVAAGALVPGVRGPVVRAAKSASGPTSDALSSQQPAILWGVAAASLILIALLVLFVVRQGRGHTATLVTAASGSLVIEAKVAEELLKETLSRDPAIVSVGVAAFRVRSQSVLRVTAQTRRGASPVDVRSTIDRAVAEWHTVLGAETPVVIQIVAGVRTRISGASRVA